MCLQHRIGDTVLVRIGESDARNFFGTECFQIFGAWRFHLGKWDRRCSVLFWICRFSQPLAHKKIDPHWSLPGAAENIALRHFFSGPPIGYGVIPIFFPDHFVFAPVCALTSNQLQQLEEVRNRMLRSIVRWAPLVDNDWHALMQKMNRNFKMHRNYSMLDHGLKDCWLEDFVLQRKLDFQWNFGPLLQVSGIPTKGGKWITVLCRTS